MIEQDHPVSHHIIHPERPPLRWEQGLPLGNGRMGVMVWGDGNPLNFTLDHADLWDLRSNNEYMSHPDFNYAVLQRLVAEGRFDEVDEVFEKRQLRDNPIGPTKVSLGRASLQLGVSTAYSCQLELGVAAVRGTLQTSLGTHEVHAFVHRDRNVFCLRVTQLAPSEGLQITPLSEMNDALATLNHPQPTVQVEGDLRILAQRIPGGLDYALVWNTRGPDFFLAIETAGDENTAISLAKSAWHQAARQGFDALYEEHLQAWVDFWSEATVYLPERWAEFLWYYGVYLLASSSHPEASPPGLQGLWPMDGVIAPWRGDYHADMNVQETFWPAFASGHLRLVDNWCDLMRRCLPQAQEFTRQFFGTEGAFWLCCTLPGYTPVPCWHTVQFGWSHSGWLAWLVWLRWRYSMDTEWLADTGYPIVSEIFKFYRANLVEEDDGCLHVPLSSSPEYRENKPEAWCKDPNIDLALIRRCCDWVVEMEEALGKADPSPSAREVRQKLAPYALTAGKALCLWPGKPLDESHRHPSHLMAVHPAMDLTMEEDDDTRQIIEASLEHYFALGQYLWAGHTYAQMASFGAVVGRAEFAYDCLRQLDYYWLGPNGLHFNRDTRNTGRTAYRGQDLQFTLEASCGIAAGISDMLVQGWRDVIRVFPAVPERWTDLAFRNLLTEGAFRVSALRRAGQTVYVSVVAGVNRTLRLRNPFDEGEVMILGAELRLEGDLFIADLEAGQEVELWLKGKWSPDDSFRDCAMLARDDHASRSGLQPRGLT